MEIINFEDFSKVDLRVAKILGAVKVDGSSKLIKIIINIHTSIITKIWKNKPEQE